MSARSRAGLAAALLALCGALYWFVGRDADAPVGSGEPVREPDAVPDSAGEAYRLIHAILIENDPGQAQVMRHRLLLRLEDRDAWPNEEDLARLLWLLTDSSADGCAIIGEALAQLRGDEAAAAQLVDHLLAVPAGSGSLAQRRALYRALGGIAVPATAPVLIARLETEPDALSALVVALESIGTSESLDALVTLLDNAQLPADLRETIDSILMRSGDERVRSRAAERLRTADDGAVRASYYRILAGSASAGHAAAFRELLDRERDPDARMVAIQSLSLFGDRESGQLTVALLLGDSDSDRAAAIRGVRDTPHAAILECVSTQWPSLDAATREAWIRAAERLDEPTDALVEIAREHGARDESATVRQLAAQLMGKRGGDANVDALASVFERAEADAGRRAALGALLRIGTPLARRRALALLPGLADEKERAAWSTRLGEPR